ncbi:hypothetical protein JGU66_28655 [Myxococcaceae bacterium JPH2]|nr:hypothetical protein [Myxococcaceae bacterium JPH2]
MLALGLTTLLLTATLGAEPPCTGRTASGEVFATCFEPDFGPVVGTGLRLGQGPASLEVLAGLLLSTGRESHSKGTPWYNRHRLLLTETWKGERTGYTFTAYDGLLRRHLEDGFILVPTARPVRIPFPFDVAVALKGAHLERRAWEGPGWVLETAQVGLLVDPLRANSPRRWLAVGPAASHVLRHTPNGTEHEVSPFTSLRLDLGWQSEDGGWTVHASGLAGWSYDFEQGAHFRARAEGSLERVVLALNDQPVALRLAGTVIHGDAGLARRDEWSVSAGIVVRPFSAR